MRTKVLVIVGLIVLAVLTILPAGSSAEECCPTLTQVSLPSYNLTSNFTVAAGECLCIEAGANLTLALDVFIFVDGEITIGESGGEDVNITNTGDRLGGGIVLINCAEANFYHVNFQGLSIGVEAVYSSVWIKDCRFVNNGIGVYSYESKIHLDRTLFTGCDLASHFARSYVDVIDCDYIENIQSVWSYTPFYRLESFYKFQIESIYQTYTAVGSELEMGLSVTNSRFEMTGIGISSERASFLTIASTSFTECKNGIESKLTPLEITYCSFETNKNDYEVYGRDVYIHDCSPPPANYSVYWDHYFMLSDDDGEPLAQETITIGYAEGDLLDHEYATDADGNVTEVLLLHVKATEGVETVYDNYNLSVTGYDEPYHFTSEQQDVQVSTLDLMVEEEGMQRNKLLERSIAIVLFVLIFTLGISAFAIEKMKKRKQRARK